MIEANGVFRVILCYIRNTAFLLQHATSSQQGLENPFLCPDGRLATDEGRLA